jgi:2-polyprenyl-3-methyl-5-hydroxy-6-metoxy-1,4-benzoquinol methylase
MKSPSAHQELIIDQFTRQATPFAEKPEHRDAAIMARLLRFARVGPGDTVLDVACGPGLLACAFATEAKSVTGIDLTPAMIAKARDWQQQNGLANVTWDLGECTALPYGDHTFSMVTTRYSLHHFPDPLKAWKEMVRVCQPGGTVVVADVALPLEKAAAYDRFETLRDPSHVRALTLAEFPQMAQQAGLTEIRTDFYRLEMETEKQIAASFPEETNRQALRDLLRHDLGRDELGFAVEQRGPEIWFSYPVLVVAGRKP